MAVWFTIRLDDRPGSLARLAGALGDHGINITGIVGVAEDTDGELMLTTSDAAATRDVLSASGVGFAEHDSNADEAPANLADVRQGLADRGMDVEAR
jgi:hypothetical protein